MSTNISQSSRLLGSSETSIPFDAPSSSTVTASLACFGVVSSSSGDQCSPLLCFSLSLDIDEAPFLIHVPGLMIINSRI